MIKILCAGKIKEKYLVDLITDYKKRISKYHSIEIIEVNDVGSLEKEGKLLEKHIHPKDYVITLEIQGHELTSEQFADKIDKTFIHYPTITFIIGSSLGLEDTIKQRSNYALCFSKLTYPHGLFRGILLEQIYRAFKIINNETYHK